MLIKDVMTPAPICCKPTDTLDIVAKVMAEHDCGVIPICEMTKVLGVVTDRDITCRAVATGRTPSDIPVSEVMTRKVFTVAQDQDVQAAIDLMEGSQVRRLPVVNAAGDIVGIVAPSDLAPSFASMDVNDFLLRVSYWNRKAIPAA